jgi:hypothetical protein
MTATLSQARDQVLATFKAAWDVGPPSSTVQVIYDGVESDKPENAATPWARVSVRHNPVQPGAVTLGRAPDGKRRYTRTGLVFVQLFTPLGDGLSLADQLATIARSAFEGVVTTPGNVIFRAVSVNEVGSEVGPEKGGWFQTNVTAQFEYDEIV